MASTKKQSYDPSEDLKKIFGVFGYSALPVDKIVRSLEANKVKSTHDPLKFFGHNITRATSVNYLPALMMMIGKLEGATSERAALFYLHFMWMGFKEHPEARDLDFFDVPDDAMKDLWQRARLEVEKEYLGSSDEMRKLFADARETASSYESFNSILKESKDFSIQSFLVAIWTAYETFTADLWENLVNRNPSLIKTIKDKQINADILAKYDYQIKSRMGTLLKDKYKFKNANDIKKAFVDILGVEAEPILGKHDLFILEKIRHLVVHRASRVDDEFVRHTKSKVEVGKVLRFDEKDAHDYALVVIESVIEIVDLISSKNLR